jgi:hypothetical protein
MMVAAERLRWLMVCLAALVVAGSPAHPLAQEVLHGADAVFRAGTLTIVWAIDRDRDEAKTVVVVRVVDTGKRVVAVAVDGLDPFTKKRTTLASKRAVDGSADIAIPRSRFADWPQSEFHFYAAGSPDPVLTVYYLGVPDTTPEFADDAAARRYLGQTAK